MKLGDMKITIVFKRNDKEVIASAIVIPDWFVKLTVAEIEDFNWMDDFVLYLYSQATAWRTEYVKTEHRT